MFASRTRAAGIFAGAAFLLLTTVSLSCRADSVASVQNTTSPPPPAPMTAEQDHQYMMNELHITSIRGGAEGFNKSAPNYQNTDESKANPYPNIPDALVMDNGKKVTSAKMWWKQRRPQIEAAFDEDVYGKVPKNTPK